ncbi:hypothetical protein DAPPUDRAFT_254429 [Daphnia pulex]|uniref:DNA2/NAM7 helicase-like C-terminal domain-containing protein n=1 Tax=Daphnia pulex TaxID=6669 RepID=E9H6V4_DAPPU|nr:hypothetical protein DAPPUDRAFT_254429 [Daphnia pulex]|eukprot:EFX72466.1 hypothetical protein DAPPUDRAFT_254429 [Daphnia pulex]
MPQLHRDHQQLRPSVNVHQLASKYHLDVSLFERLIMGGMKAVRLGVQMRAECGINKFIPITILAIYTAQLHQLLESRKQLKCTELTHVRMTFVDNFQVEKNDVIILSLVRNNKRNLVSFLRIDNRDFVALSHARNDLYILGNILFGLIWRKS